MFRFKPITQDKLVRRMKAICAREKVQLELPSLIRIAEHSDNDIRSALISLEMVSKLSRSSRSELDKVLLEQKVSGKVAIDYVAEVMTDRAKSAYIKK